MTVSVVTPTLNSAPTLRQTIDSVLTQDHPHVEYLVVDGGSTDGTVALLEEACVRYGDRLRWTSESDTGQSNAINKGLGQLKGDVVAWLNADDVYAPGAIAKAVSVLEDQQRAGLVYGQADFVDGRGRHIGNCVHIEPFDRRRLLRVSNFIVQPAAFIRRRAFEQAGGLDESLHYAMDYDLWLKISAAWRVVHVPCRWASVRWTDQTKTARGGMNRIDEVAHVAARHGYHRLPAYFALEKASLLLGQRRPVAAVKTLVCCPAALAALGSPSVWNVIAMRKRRARYADVGSV